MYITFHRKKLISDALLANELWQFVFRKVLIIYSKDSFSVSMVTLPQGFVEKKTFYNKFPIIQHSYQIYYKEKVQCTSGIVATLGHDFLATL